jgi:hypothetical protein
MEPRVAEGGTIEERIKQIKINHPALFALGGSFRLQINDALDVLWVDGTNTYLLLSVIGTDSRSGFSRVFTQRFYNKRNQLKDGDYAYGDSLDVR